MLTQGLTLGVETLGAVLAGEGHVLVVATHVNPQLAALTERLATQLTQVAFTTRVPIHVRLQRPCLEEAHPTDVASVTHTHVHAGMSKNIDRHDAVETQHLRRVK